MQSTARPTKSTPSIAPTFPQSAADQWAHAAASYRRGDSDPNMDEVLRRVQTELAYLERKQQLAMQDSRESDEGVAA